MKKILSIITAVLCAMMLIWPATAMADAAIGGEYNFREASYYVIVDAPDGYVNFRYGPGLEYGIITPIYNGVVLYVDYLEDNMYDGLTWGEIYYDGRYGWVSISQTSPYNPEPATTAYVEPATQPYVEPTTEAPEEEKLYGNQTKISAYDNAVSDMFSGAVNDYSFSVPMVNINSVDAQKVNKEIEDNVMTPAQQALNVMLTTGNAADLIGTSYDWYLSGDVLSIVIRMNYIGPWHEYLVYNFAIPGGELLDDEAVMKYGGYTKEEYRDDAWYYMDIKFLLMNSRTQYNADGRNSDIYNKQHQETLSDENINETMPYVDGNGNLCFIGRIYLFEMQNSESWEDIDCNDKYLNASTFVMVNASDNYCNLRTGAGVKYDIITPIYNGTVLPVTETTISQEDGLEWGKTKYYGEEGWISISQTTPAYR